MDLNPFIDWVRDGKGRKVSIELGEYGDNEKISIWAYDYIYATGQYVQSVDEIDIAKKKEDDERRQYEQLKKKFEG